MSSVALHACAVALTLGSLLLTTRLSWATSSTIVGNENISVTDNSGPVTIKVSGATTNQYTYNNQFGMTEGQILGLTASIVKANTAASAGFRIALFSRLDQLGAKLKQIADTQQKILDAQTEIATAQQTAAADQADRISALRAEISTRTADVKKLQNEATELMLAAINKIPETLESERQARERAERRARHDLTGFFSLGGDVDVNASATRFWGDLDIRGQVLSITEEWGLELGARLLFGSLTKNTRYQDGAGRVLQSNTDRDFTEGFQLEVGVRGRRSSVWCFPAALGWRAWDDWNGGSSTGHWAATAEAGLEWRGPFALGASLVGTLELSAAQANYTYTGVGAQTLTPTTKQEGFVGGRLYAAYQF